MKTKQQAPALPATAGPRLVYWISLQEAESRFEVTRPELVRAVRSGAMQTRRILCGEELVVAVSSQELERDYSTRVTPRDLEGAPVAHNADRPSLADAALRTELEEERVARAHLEGQLESSARVERSLQRYADRLEGELKASRQEAMTLARALGRAEQLASSAQAQLAAPTPTERRSTRAKRWWQFGS